jgi:hypothetical protein
MIAELTAGKRGCVSIRSSDVQTFPTGFPGEREARSLQMPCAKAGFRMAPLDPAKAGDL